MKKNHRRRRSELNWDPLGKMSLLDTSAISGAAFFPVKLAENSNISKRLYMWSSV